MDTNVQALKELYVSLGGKASDVADMATSSEVITAMKSVAASAASELPAVTASDYGSILRVGANGKWTTWGDGFADNVLVGVTGDSVTVVPSGEALAKTGFFVSAYVLLSGVWYLFQKVKVDSTNIYYLSTTRENGKTVYKEVVIPKTSSIGSRYTVTTTEVPDPTVPEA